MNNPEFWLELDKLVKKFKIVIDRPKGKAHPRFPDFIYPVDYGYLEGTTTVDGGGLDIWVGSAEPKIIDAIVCTVDPYKNDAEIKILFGCNEEEKQKIVETHNRLQKGILIRRNEF